MNADYVENIIRNIDDEHLKVLYYEQNSAKIFNNTDIKGGVVITYHDREKECGAIQIFTAYPLLNTIIQKVKKQIKSSLSDIVFAPESYKFTKQMYVDHPEILSMTMISKGKEVPLISKGHDYDTSRTAASCSTASSTRQSASRRIGWRSSTSSGRRFSASARRTTARSTATCSAWRSTSTGRWAS